MPKNQIQRPLNVAAADVKRLILEEDDFGHEMRVGYVYSKLVATNAARDKIHFAAAEHGWAYTDPNTNKARQFDFRFRISYNAYPAASAVALAVECKNLHKSSPLIVCGRRRTSEESQHCFIRAGRDVVVMAYASTSIVRNSRLYPVGEFVGKSLVRIKEKNGRLEAMNDADVFDRWSQAESSCFALIGEARHRARQTQTKFDTLVLPVVVVPDGSLWKMVYDADGNVPEDPGSIDACELFIGKEVRRIFHSFSATFILLRLRGFRTS